MNNELTKKVNDLDNSQVVQLFNFLGNQLLEGLEEDDLSGKITPELQSEKKFSLIMDMDEDTMLKNISPEDSAEIARIYLLYMAEDEYLSPILAIALEEFKEKQVLIVETVLAIGFAASMLIFASTTEIKGNVFGIEFNKIAASPELVKAIMEPFTKILDIIKT